MKIRKRDGTTVRFDAMKIHEAVSKAAHSLNEVLMEEEDIEKVVSTVVTECKGKRKLTVEHVQDMVEFALIEHGFASTAKAYILYRAEHAKLRQTEHDLMDVYHTLTNASDADIKRENANINADTSMGTMLKYGSEGAKYYVLNYVLPKHIAEAHRTGAIHIHDLDFYMLTETCCQIDVGRLLAEGFNTGHGHIRTPSNIKTAANLTCIIIQSNQNEMHGGQSVPALDYFLAPYVEKTFQQYLRKETSNLTLTYNNALTYEGEFATGVRNAIEQTEDDTYQAMEAFVHNLNTMQSRAGSQVPFSSVNYGTDTSACGRLVTKMLLKATEDGLGLGETPIFPVQIFKLRKGYNYETGDPNYDLFQYAMKVSAKRLYPNFSSMDTAFNAQYLKGADPNYEVAYMGCRTRVMGNVHGNEQTFGRGNLSFTSINLPRIAMEGKASFMERLDETIDLVIEQLLLRFKVQCRRTPKNYPFLFQQGVWLDSEGLSPNDDITDALSHGTLTIGFIGLAETLTALTGQHHGESEEAQALGLRIVSHMRKRCDDASEKYHLNFSLIATPAESLCLAGETLIQTENGAVPIKDIKEGDIIKAYDIEAKEVVYDTVIASGMTSRAHRVMRLVFRDEAIVCTHEHIVPVVNKRGIDWIPARYVKPNNKILGAVSTHTVERIETVKEDIPVYDITTEVHHNFIVGSESNGIVVHNSGRFVSLDKERYGIIEGITDKEWYTNSFHIPVQFPIPAHKKVEIEAPYHALCNAGHISYIEFDGDPTANLQAFESIVRYMHDKGMGYFSINHAVDRDPICGYIGIIKDVCPRCGRAENQPLDKHQIAYLRKNYPNAPIFCSLKTQQ